MTLRRSLVSLLIAVGTAGSAMAQVAPTQQGGSDVNATLNQRFANGIVAVAEEKIITVADVMQYIGPLLPQLRAEARTEKEFYERLEQLQDSAIQDLIDRVLIVKEFRKDEKRQIPRSYVENAISDEIAERFEGDRSKFLAYLRSRGVTMREYQREKEEDIIFQYMQGQQRKSQSVVSPVRIETYYNENKDRFYREDEVHLRLIQLTRTETETDESLRQTSNRIHAELKAGRSFADLAKEYSKDAKRAKGGDWGPLKRSDFREEFSKVAFALEKGQASEPIVLPEGYYILYAEDRRFAGIQPIDEVRDMIERLLVQQMGRANQERWLERLRRNGYIKHY